MNPRTGSILECDLSNMISIKKGEATVKQWKGKRVDLRDGRSILGKRLSKMRNQPCPCGSGKKFKKCCIDRVREV